MRRIRESLAFLLMGLVGGFYAPSPPLTPLPLLSFSSQATRTRSRGFKAGVKHQDIPEPTEIDVLKGVDTEHLPTSFVAAIPISVVGADSALYRISDSESEGWCNPRSWSQLWISDGLNPTPSACLSVQALLKDGSLRCLFPGLDVTCTRPDGHVWRNLGLKSYPMSQVWLDYSTIPLASLRVSAYCRPVVTLDSDDEPINDRDWVTLTEKLDIQDAIMKVIELAADPPKELQGFHVVSVPIEGGEVPVPSDGAAFRVYMSDYPDPSKLLELPNVASGSAVLEVIAAEVASGAESEFLPGVYRGLYG